MNVIFMALAMMPLVLQVTNVNAADQVKPIAVERGATSVKSGPLLQGGVTITESSQIYRPLPPEEEEKLGREGVKRKMMERKP